MARVALRVGHKGVQALPGVVQGAGHISERRAMARHHAARVQ